MADRTIIALAALAEDLPGGKWETSTACSYRRITAREDSGRRGPDGGVLHALRQSDGHPDLSWSERQCDAICAIINIIRATASGGLAEVGATDWNTDMDAAPEGEVVDVSCYVGAGETMIHRGYRRTDNTWRASDLCTDLSPDVPYAWAPQRTPAPLPKKDTP